MRREWSRVTTMDRAAPSAEWSDPVEPVVSRRTIRRLLLLIVAANLLLAALLFGLRPPGQPAPTTTTEPPPLPAVRGQQQLHRRPRPAAVTLPVEQVDDQRHREQQRTEQQARMDEAQEAYLRFLARAARAAR